MKVFIKRKLLMLKGYIYLQAWTNYEKACFVERRRERGRWRDTGTVDRVK